MFAKHLPPSANLPRVLALDAESAAGLPAEIELVLQQAAASISGRFDAVVGVSPGQPLGYYYELLRPGGRLILAAEGSSPDALLGSLTAAGFIHCLVESENSITLLRGERPPSEPTPGRLAALVEASPGVAAQVERLKFVYLLIAQTPNKPAWKLAPQEKITWQAATLLDRQGGAPVLLAFSSLVRAVNYMQPAVLAGKLKGINKVGKFASALAQTWGQPLLLNPAFDDLRDATPGDLFEVNPQAAITGEE